MPTLQLTPTALFEALDVNTYRQTLAQRYGEPAPCGLVDKVYTGEGLTADDVADLYMDPRRMWSFISGMASELPKHVKPVIAEAAWQEGQPVPELVVFANRALTALGQLPEGPFFYGVTTLLDKDGPAGLNDFFDNYLWGLSLADAVVKAADGQTGVHGQRLHALAEMAKPAVRIALSSHGDYARFVLEAPGFLHQSTLATPEL